MNKYTQYKYYMYQTTIDTIKTYKTASQELIKITQEVIDENRALHKQLDEIRRIINECDIEDTLRVQPKDTLRVQPKDTVEVEVVKEIEAQSKWNL